MAGEKLGYDYSVDSLEIVRESLEKTLDQFVATFQSQPKSTIKRRLKRRAKAIQWADPILKTAK